MKLAEALKLVPVARAAGWRDVTVGPDDPHLADKCVVVGRDPADGVRREFVPKAKPAENPELVKG